MNVRFQICKSTNFVELIKKEDDEVLFAIAEELGNLR